MKTFSMQLLDYDDRDPEVITEDNPPGWLISDEYRWFWEDHVLTMEVGESVETDFQTITRTT